MDKLSNSIEVKKNMLEKVYSSKKMDTSFSNLAKKIDLTEKEIKNNLFSLEDSVEELNNCKNCKGLFECKNKVKGYVYYPEKKESKVSFSYIACKHLNKHEKSLLEKDVNMQLNNARMKDIDVTDKNRSKLIKWLKSFYDNYDSSKIIKGLYLHGTFGSGKTFLIAALFNELKEKKNVNSEIIFLSELLRNLKDDFNSLESKVRYYSSIELLLIDDIGAEKVSEWSRDEILGTILQSRMNNHLTTFFTSNLDIKELEKHLSITKDSEDVVKARRIIERIKQLTEDLELISANRRN